MRQFLVANCGCVRESFLSFQLKPFECYSPPLLSRGYSQYCVMCLTIFVRRTPVNSTGVPLANQKICQRLDGPAPGRILHPYRRLAGGTMLFARKYSTIWP